MNESIAIIGWGSLIWDPRGLPICGEWHLDGPLLPVEFSRISKDQRLTLVIDEKHGLPVPTRFAISKRNSVKEALSDLQAREGCQSRGVAESLSEPRTYSANTVHLWAKSHGLSVAIWTSLPSNFEEKTKMPFSVRAALEYLAALTEPARSQALEYIRKAPPEVMTPFRSQVLASQEFKVD